MIPKPIFQNVLPAVEWIKIYSREYGVQYSEMAILCLSPKAKYHIPAPSVCQIVIPENNNTAFYIDKKSWDRLVSSLNQAYTANIKKLEQYENAFVHDGKQYLAVARKISRLNLAQLSNKKLLSLYRQYQEKLFRYSVFAWTAFILNNYIADKATKILDDYLKKYKYWENRQEMIDILFHPAKLAAGLKLQSLITSKGKTLSDKDMEKYYLQFRWLSCLDIHNKPWTKKEFRKHISSLSSSPKKKIRPLSTLKNLLKIKPSDWEYLLMANRFVYIKDARDDYRRQGVFLATKLFAELGKRIKIDVDDTSYLQAIEIEKFLLGKKTLVKQDIIKRKKGFVLYLGADNKPICLQDADISLVLTKFKFILQEKRKGVISGNIASKGMAFGNVVIVKGVKDLNKVKNGNVMVAVVTHPDYLPAMRKAVAIVTDEGGITSHAAIVSREFGIPCIVGTKIATSALHDGDKVEVDAEKGTVRIIKLSS